MKLVRFFLTYSFDVYVTLGASQNFSASLFRVTHSYQVIDGIC